MKHLFLLAILALSVSAQTPDPDLYCHLTGTLEKKKSGLAAPRVVLRIVRVVKAGVLITSPQETVQSETDGSVSFYLRRGSTACFYAEIEGLNRNATIGTCFAIPDATTGDFNTLVPVTSVPTTIAMPALSAANNNKFLKIQDGAIVAASSSASVNWGNVGGTLSDQTDLVAALASKSDTSHTHTFSSLTSKPTTLSGYGITDAASATHTHAQSDITGLVSALAGKQATLVSGTNIKTVNGTSLLGSGNVSISGGTWGGITGTLSDQSDLQAALDAKQAADADLTTYAGITPSANVQTLLGAANYAAFKTLLSLNNVENTAISTWTGSTNITTLGTIAAGTWNGTAIGDSYISSAATWNAKVSTGAITGSGLTMATARLLGRSTASTGAVEEISIGSGLSLSGGTLSATGGGGGGAWSALTDPSGNLALNLATYSTTWTVNDSATNAVSTPFVIGHNTSGTAAAGFGTAIKFQLESSTTADQDAASLRTYWSSATHSSRSAVFELNTISAGSSHKSLRVGSYYDTFANSNLSVLYLDPTVTPSSSNFNLAARDNILFLNGASQLQIMRDGVVLADFTATYINIGRGNYPLAVGNFGSPSAQLHAVSDSASRVGLRVDSAASPSQPIATFYNNSTEYFRVSHTASSNETNLWLWDGSTLQKVVVGAADSGGTGYRLLRIAN